MVNRVLLKETKNFISKNKKTYIAQIIIIMLGVGFFVGMKVASLDLQKTMTKFVEENNFYDIKVNLEYGIAQEDIPEIKDVLKEVKHIEGGYSIDLVNNFDGEDQIVRIHSYNKENKINTLKIKKGKLPENNNECVIDTKMAEDGYKIGDEITLDNKYLKEKTLKITGIIQSPEYLAIDRGNSILLSGKINYYVYVLEENINSTVYSELYIKYDTPEKAFTEEYDDYIEKKEIETTYAISGYYKEKFNDLITQYQIDITTARAKYDAEKSKIDAQFKEAENEIENKKELLEDAKKAVLSTKDIEKKIKETTSGDKSAQQENVNKAKKVMEESKKQYNTYTVTVNNLQNSLDKKKNELATVESTIKTKEEELNQLQLELARLESSTTTTTTPSSCPSNYSYEKNMSGKVWCCQSAYSGFCPYYLSDGKLCSVYGNSCTNTGTTTTTQNNQEEINNTKAKISALEKELADLYTKRTNLNKDISDLTTKLTNAKTTLVTYETTYKAAKLAYEEQLEIYNSLGSDKALKEYYKKQNNELNKTIKQYEAEIKAAETELENQRKIAYAELNNISQEINNLEDVVNTLTCPNSYIFDRKDNSGYAQFIADIDKISNLAIVVPVVFYFITFFMISASINRMLHEERNQIGTLKAIGIRDKEILTKYLIYSISSVVLGSLLGIIIGVVILPLFVYFIYEMLYEFPSYELIFNVKYFLIASGIAFVVAIASTLISCKETFKEIPVALLKAKQEKEATNSLFEKVPFIWNKLSLTTKISIKNIFRYKTRMLMTVIGIGGCLALMLTGLSLRTSITEMIPTQYGKIFKVDAQIFYNEISTRETLEEGTKKIMELENVKDGMLTNFQTFTSDVNGGSISINLVTFIEDGFDEFIEIRDYKNNKKMKLSSEGVIISEKLAKLKEIDVGDVIKLKDKQQQEYSMIVTGIAKNYIEHYVYLNPEYYAKVFNTEPRKNMLLLKLEGKYKEIELAQKITETNIVNQVLFVSIAEKAYDDVMNNLALLVGVFVVFSILLVFAVLYNLININIRERSKEIATYKVLGFKNRKVISIVKRENIVLMVIGVIFGIVAGYFLSIIVIQTCEVENLNFIKNVTLENILLSTVSTIIFTLLFSLIINKYVKKINLTESLKSNE